MEPAGRVSPQVQGLGCVLAGVQATVAQRYHVEVHIPWGVGVTVVIHSCLTLWTRTNSTSNYVAQA